MFSLYLMHWFSVGTPVFSYFLKTCWMNGYARYCLYMTLTIALVAWLMTEEGLRRASSLTWLTKLKQK